ncbi:MAG: hypothetical protein KAW45_03585 [Thermoplasmatales archaeon]|nr:hypothetical protein [Thermoplasmatales archaeon]
MEREEIIIRPINLEWSDWFSWNDLKIDTRSGNGIKMTNYVSGVYEARYEDKEERLMIGKATDLRMRVRQGLVKGKTPHSAGEKIRVNENVSRIVVRWSATDKPCAVEEELHRKYQKKFGRLPKYVQHT